MKSLRSRLRSANEEGMSTTNDNQSQFSSQKRQKPASGQFTMDEAQLSSDRTVTDNEWDSSTENEDDVDEHFFEEIENRGLDIENAFEALSLKTEDVADRYFLAQGTRSKVSKDSFASKQVNLDLEEDEIKEIIQKDYDFFCKQLKIVPYDDGYLRKIYHMLKSTTLNVLLYGFGSKLKMLNAFTDGFLSNRHHYIVLRGFSMDITLKQIILVLNRATGNTQDPVFNEPELFEEIKECFTDEPLYLVVHSIDILFTKNVKIATFITHLFQTKANIRVIASVDHVNSPLLWSVGENSIFEWAWFPLVTHEPYHIEKKSSSGISMVSTSSKSWKLSIDLSSVKHVYESLNTNAQKIFVIILKYFISSRIGSGYPFHDLYLNCREEFLVNSEITLRAQLSEFKDHNLLKVKKAPDGSELIAINVDKETVRQFIESLENGA